MREGLRSGVSKAKPEVEQVFGNSVEIGERLSVNHDSELKGFGVEEDEKSNSRLVGSGTMVSAEVSEMGEGDGSEDQQCREDEDLGGIRNPVFTRNLRKRSRVDEDGGDCFGRKAKKEGSRQKVPISSRVLRSRSSVKREEHKEVDWEATEGVLERRISAESGGCETAGETDVLDGKLENKLKYKHDTPSRVGGNDDEDPIVKFPEEEVLKPECGKVQGNDEAINLKPLEEDIKLPDEEVLKHKCGGPLEVLEKIPIVKPPNEEGMKRKRGRPFKLQEKVKVSSVQPPKEEMPKRKRGRSFKLHGNKEVSNAVPLREGLRKMEHLKEVEAPEAKPLKEFEAPEGLLKRKRGRPPKLKVENDKEEEPKGLGKCKNVKFDPGERNGLLGKSTRRGRPPKGFKIARRDANLARVMQRPLMKNSYLGRKRNGTKLNSRRFLPAMKNKYGNLGAKDDKALRGSGPKVVHAIISKKHKGRKGVETKLREEKGGERRKAQQSVRDRIVDILLSAGWTIDYRQRNTKAYQDAVYVNPDGKTHWSVTLAYSKFLEQYEADQVNSNPSKTDFVFTPIPEEDLSILKRIVTKKRTSKKNLQSGDTSDEDISSGKEMHVRNRKRQGAQSKRRYALLARSSKDGVESDVDNYTPYNGKRTVLAWMVDLGTVPLNGKVQYMNQRKTHIKLEGRLTMDGIHCECCRKIFTISNFETHAGSNLSRPSENIYLENGSSLLQCQLDSWNKQEESECKEFHSVDAGGEDPNDDTCGICGDGGDLICCDGCPSTFHQSCLDIQTFPSGDWHCVYCSCKYCGIARMRAPQGAGSEVAVSTLLSCYLCQEKYHQPCIQPGDAIPPDSISSSFCGKNCQELSEKLQMLIGVKHELEEGFSWKFIRRSDIKSDTSQNGVYQQIECNSKLAVALSVMNECFLPITDHRSGINLIRNILYNSGSNFNRLDYSGFVTAILEKDDEIISAASIRIHGNHLAEMPFIGTRNLYRRQGMCRRLLTAIESALCSLRVEKLVIPAISELKQTWTSVFGFKPLESSSRQKMRNINMMVFPGVEMLQKPTLNHHEEIISSAGMELTDPGKEHQNNSDERCSAEPDSGVFTISDPPTVDMTNDKLVTAEPVSHHPDGSPDDTSNLTCETLNAREHQNDVPSGDIEEESKVIANSSTSLHNVDNNKPIEETGEDQNAHAPDMETVEVDSQVNHCEPTVDSFCDDLKNAPVIGVCGDLIEPPEGDTDLKPPPTQLQPDLNSTDTDSSQPLENANSSQQLKPESPIEQKKVTLEISETLCSSSPGSDMAQGMILANQAGLV